MECVVCGSTNFTKESGFYFCCECQTQSQEIKEHAFQEETIQTQIKSARKIQKTKTSSTEKITSWECYNIVLLSLTEELINLGAHKSLKKIVKCLWIRYLEKLEIIHLEKDRRPKLPLVHIKKDINITYGVKKRTKKRKKSSSESSFTESTSRRARSRKKMALAQSEYSEISSKVDSSSLHNETLTSLKSTSEKSNSSEEKLIFNRHSWKELQRRMTYRHLKSHKTDLRTDLKCHKFTYKNCSSEYIHNVFYISPTKLYVILYVGLLILKDPIQLGDFFRFLREGHLNFNRFTLLFPDSYMNKGLNIHNHAKNSWFSHKAFREITMKLVQFLGVEQFIQCPDLVALADRYCQELNLPDDILEAVKNILARNPMKFRNHKKTPIIPNYEARVISLIIFTLKLFYGLDNVTEYHLANYSRTLNAKYPNLKMFDIEKWMEFIKYRSLLVSEHHFPTYNMIHSDINADLFLQYKLSHNILNNNDQVQLMSDMVGYKELLTKIRNLQYDYITHIEYPPDLKPFTTYSYIINKIIENDNLDEILRHNFNEDSLDCLLNPMVYLLKFKERIHFGHGGANNNWIIESMVTENSCRSFITRQDRKFVPVQITSTNVEGSNKLSSKVGLNKVKDTVEIQENFEKYHSAKFDENLQHLLHLHNNYPFKFTIEETDSKFNYDKHFNPYERYWLYLRTGAQVISKEKFNIHFDKLSDNFKLVFSECSRIVDQTNQELFVEFQNVELYLIYCGHYKDTKKRRKFSNLKGYIRKTEYCW